MIVCVFFLLRFFLFLCIIGQKENKSRDRILKIRFESELILDIIKSTNITVLFPRILKCITQPCTNHVI